MTLRKTIAKVEKRRLQQILRDAKAICVLMDDRGEWRLIQARVTHLADGAYKSTLFLLSMVRRNGASCNLMGDMDEDYGVRTVAATDEALRRLCTGETLDESLLGHICKNVMTLVSDGCPAALKSMRCHATAIFPNVALIIRDACHAIRISTKEPLSAMANSKTLWLSLRSPGTLWHVH